MSLAEREEAALRTAADEISDSVVQIRTIGGLDTLGGAVHADGPTTGLVISSDGYIVSSTFNFTQQPASILVNFASGKQAPAELVATDHSRKLVLLKVVGVADLKVPTLAPANDIRVGQWAVAIGRTFRVDRTNVSVGIVSATGRMFGKVLQTDADVSTANYGGPLVDIRGRVLGVLVPMAPQGAGEVAGAEWYDSGIGFAVPLATIADALERMKKGDDQHAGLLGIGLSPKNPHSARAALAAVRPDSPAGLAGLKKGDRIVEVDGQAINTQTDLRFALGPRYGGENVRIVAMRGDERIERTIMLADELKAFRHAFLGILPRRPIATTSADSDGNADQNRPDLNARDPDDDNAVNRDNADDVGGAGNRSRERRGVVVRMVYPGSPAAEAGIREGDRLVRINDASVATIDEAIAELNNVAPGGTVALRMIRSGETQEVKLTTTSLPTHVPAELPPAFEHRDPPSPAATDAARPAATEVKPRKLKLAEFKQSCLIYEPASTAGLAPGVLLWLHAPGDANPKDVIATWQPICDRDNLVLVVPTAADASRWERTELEYLRKLAERVIRQYRPDPHRVVVYGQDGGGAMAWLLGLSSRDLFRGIATTAAPLPRQVLVPENEPAARLAIFAGLSSDDAAAAQMAQGLQELSDAGYPVSTVTAENRAGELSPTRRDELARWIDTLDRF